MQIMKKGLLLGASLALLAASGTGASAQYGDDAAINAVKNAVGSAIENARDSVYNMRDRAVGAPPMRSRFSAEPTVEDAFAALGYAPRDPKSPMYTKGPIVAPAPATLVSVWGSVTGSTERRSFGLLLPGPVNFDSRSDSITGLGGIDVVKTGIFTSNDAIILGALGGDTESRGTGGNGGAAARTSTSSPTGGVYAAYLNGGFSTDASFTGIFSRTNTLIALPLPGFRSLQDTNAYVFENNYQYRFKISDDSWIEPTAGYSYTRSEVTNSIPFLGAIPDTETWRVQGGVRVGTTTNWFGTRVQPSIYGGVYEDVSQRPAPIVQNAATDLNKLFGKGTAKLNFILSPNASVYIMGEVHGREDVLGGSGTGGFRYTF